MEMDWVNNHTYLTNIQILLCGRLNVKLSSQAFNTYYQTYRQLNMQYCYGNLALNDQTNSLSCPYRQKRGVIKMPTFFIDLQFRDCLPIVIDRLYFCRLQENNDIFIDTTKGNCRFVSKQNCWLVFPPNLIMVGIL